MKTFLKKTTALLCLCMLMPLTLLAQEMLKVQGTVTDASGEPPIGVNVRTSSSKAGAVTDMDGNYTIEVSPKATLIFSYVGFESLTEAVKGRKNINHERTCWCAQ